MRIPREVTQIQMFVPGVYKYGTSLGYQTVEITKSPRKYIVTTPHGTVIEFDDNNIGAKIGQIPWDLMPEGSGWSKS
jgi:hypothetical protein